MLTQIDVRNLAIIQNLNLDLKSGTTVITGETGAGKSILIDAIELAMGGRATSDMVRNGETKAEIYLTFDTKRYSQVKTWLQHFELDQDNYECIIRRIIHQDGRTRSFVNGAPITLQHLRELSELLIHIHGQHEHHTLFKTDMQRQMLDRYANHQLLLDQTQTLAKEWHDIHQEIQALTKIHHEQTSMNDFLLFQLQELEDLQLQAGEYQALEIEHKQLAHAEELIQNLNQVLDELANSESQAVVIKLSHMIERLRKLQRFDPKISSWIETLHGILIQINELESDITHHYEKISIDPTRLNTIEMRMRTWFDLARKHKIGPEELYDFQQQIKQKLTAIENFDERLATLQHQLTTIAENYQNIASQLSKSRAQAAENLSQEITKIVRELSLPHAVFKIDLVPNDSQFSSQGFEKIIFQITVNKGQELKPLAKVASGGELSRISLAIHMATAEQHTIPTLVFDEVDVGISGGTAEMVGKLLRRLGDTHQLICITHLPQVAAQGHQHLLVEKSHAKDITSTNIRELTSTEKVAEISRMLGGIKITKKTIEHAKEMLEKI